MLCCACAALRRTLPEAADILQMIVALLTTTYVVFDRELANAIQGITSSLLSDKVCDICPILSILRHV